MGTEIGQVEDEKLPEIRVRLEVVIYADTRQDAEEWLSNIMEEAVEVKEYAILEDDTNAA
jgi:hypothetical protein